MDMYHHNLNRKYTSEAKALFLRRNGGVKAIKRKTTRILGTFAHTETTLYDPKYKNRKQCSFMPSAFVFCIVEKNGPRLRLLSKCHLAHRARFCIEVLVL